MKQLDFIRELHGTLIDIVPNDITFLRRNDGELRDMRTFLYTAGLVEALHYCWRW